MSAAAATAVGKARALRGVQHSCVRGTARVSRPQRWRTTAAAGCPFATSVTPASALAPPAPWAADAPAPVVSLFESIGGDAAVQATVDLFYTRVPVDPELSRFFEGADIKKLRGHQVSFLTMAFGGPKKYNGGTIALAHKKMIEQQGLNSYHFDIVVGHLVACLKELGVAQSHIDEVVEIVKPLREAFPEPKFDAA